MVLVLLSPSKTLDENVRRTGIKMTSPHFQDRADELAAVLKTYSAVKLGKLMSISEKLATLNYARYQNFRNPCESEGLSVTGRDPRIRKDCIDGLAPAILAYQGDTYQGLGANNLSDEDLHWAQNHIGILTGLYGVLRPLDAMQAYRLEMGTKLPVAKAKDLYTYWSGDITAHLNTLVKKNKLSAVIGCASNEYLSSVDTDGLSVPFINCDFKENKNGKLSTVGLFAKRARGMMARFVVEHRVTDAAALKKFDSAGYKFDKKLSDETNFVFVR
jgi:cytoplasmic iron level regulating protein YaaA (DUF328/UPF0246 family)